MPLYSTGIQTNANESELYTGSEVISDPEVKTCSKSKEETGWSYLFIHHAKVEYVSKKLEERFRIFIHRTIIYKREKKKIKKDERPTISGLVFIQGNSNDIQHFLKENFFSLYLVKDCSSKQVATIPDSIMQSFMQVSEFNSTRIRFMPHAFDYYSKGNPLVRITSGSLAGLEGYRIRISRDKCFITSIGGMTVAIGGIYKENFENLDEYVRLRREQIKKAQDSSRVAFTPLQAEIDNCFFTPQNQLDVMAIDKNLIPWVMKMESAVEEKAFDEAVEIALFILEETGSHFRAVYADSRIGDVKSIMAVCEKADKILTGIMNSSDASVDLKEIVETGRESLAIRFSFLPIDL